MNSYFVVEENDIDKLIDFFDGLKIKWKLKPLGEGYTIIGAKMSLIDKMIYTLIFKETKQETWSRLRSV